MRSINREFVHVISIKLILLSCTIGSLNVLFLKSFELSLILVAFESLTLVYFLIKNDITNYIGCYLIFFTLSFEFDYVIGNDYSGFYGFKSFSLFGLNLGIIALLPILAKLLLNKLRISYVKQNHLYLYRIFISLLILFSTGIFIGLINIITNDNNVLSFSNSLSLFMGEVYQNALFPLLLVVCYIYLVSFEGLSITRLIPYIYSILFGTIAAMIISLSTQNFGFYGGILTLLAQPVSAFVPFLALLFFTHQSPIRKLLLASFYTTGLFLSLKYNASGKMLIFLVALPLLFLFYSNIMAKHKVSLSIAFFSFLAFFVYLLPMFLFDYQLLNIKIFQVSSLLDIFDKNWFYNMPDSPRLRVAEFINIVYEYLRKPWFLVFGKGFMGTIIDHQNLFGFSAGAYSNQQWASKTFYAMHTSLNSLLLTHGILGIVFYVMVLKYVWQKLIYSPIGVIGAVWFLIYYGYSATISAFGIISLLLALYVSNLNQTYKISPSRRQHYLHLHHMSSGHRSNRMHLSTRHLS